MAAFLEIVLREWRSLRREARLTVLAVAGPLAFALVVGAVYSPKKVTGLAVTIVDQDASALSRELTRAILATEPFVLGQYADSPGEFERLAAEGRSGICFVFPRGFAKDVKAGRGGAVAVLVDGTNVLATNAAVNGASAALGTYSIGVSIQGLERHGYGPQARTMAMPIAQETRTLFNPALDSNYANFLVLGMIAIPIQLAALLAVCRAGAREFTPASAGLPGLSSNIFVVAGAKCMAYVAILWPASWLTVRCTQWWFGIPMRGSEWMLAALVLWFVTSMAGLGFAISCFVKEAVFASEICAAITMPNFLISGFTWPAFGMPRALETAAYLLPMNPFALALRKITLMDAGLSDLTREILQLGGWSAVAGLAALAGARMLLGAGKNERLHS